MLVFHVLFLLCVHAQNFSKKREIWKILGRMRSAEIYSVVFDTVSADAQRL